MFLNTAERVSESSVIDNWLLKKSMLAYKYASEIIKGKVLEIGCGNAYYVEKMAGLVDEYVLLDKFKTKAVESVLKIKNVKFIQTVVPPLSQLPDNSFDYVLCFQVIEHIQKDLNLIEEIYRVLKPGGIFLVSTPNKKMSLSRNPWHVREYFVSELRDLIAKCPFSEIKCMGVFGNDKAMGYYEKNKISVKKFRRFDILGLEKRLPASLFRWAYDVLNVMNRKRLAKQNSDGIDVGSFVVDDFYIKEATENCWDLYYIIKK